MKRIITSLVIREMQIKPQGTISQAADWQTKSLNYQLYERMLNLDNKLSFCSKVEEEQVLWANNST